LRGDPGNRVDELPLSDCIVLINPTDLSFADCVHCLVTLNRPAGALRGAKAGARRDPLLDETMLLLDGVQVRRSSATAASAKLSLLFQLGG
jgi:hypothetical protein